MGCQGVSPNDNHNTRTKLRRLWCVAPGSTIRQTVVFPEVQQVAALLGKLRCKSCTATFAFLQCGCHLTNNCSATNGKLHCNIEKVAVQESGAFLPLFCGFLALTFTVCLRKHYLSNPKTLESASASVLATVINSRKIKVGIGKNFQTPGFPDNQGGRYRKPGINSQKSSR